jgi:thiol-disulfide isomerase/thioredoxin
MKNTFFLLMILAVGCAPKVNQEIYSDHESETILLGEVNWDGFTKEPYSEWFGPNYKNYQVDSTTIDMIAGKTDDITILTFMGTWCSDSKAQVPQFYKILDYLKYDLSGMMVIAIDRSDDGLIIPEASQKYEIVHVPTFIFIKGGKEIGRITEYPVKTIEKDMVDIIEN